MKRLALCLGITRVDPAAYDGWDGSCPGCDRDAARVATLAHDRGFEGVCALVDACVDHHYVVPAFEAAAERLVADDLLLLYYSGHGGQQADADGDEYDRHDETLCWYRGEVIDDQIAGYLRRLPAGVRVLLVSDSCNSGTQFKGRSDRKHSTPVKLGPAAVDGFAGSLVSFGGCADGRSSYGSDQGGAFTIALVDVLKKARKPISYADWFARAAKRMPRYQTPVLQTWGDPSFLDREALT